jgi:CheY-like chemotaxis protein
MRMFLEQQGCVVVEAADGQEAVAYAAGDGFNLVMMDLNLPVLDGYEATRRILVHPNSRHVAAEQRVPRAVDLAHPARAERRADFVSAQPRVGCEGHTVDGGECCLKTPVRCRGRPLSPSFVVLRAIRSVDGVSAPHLGWAAGTQAFAFKTMPTP